jgi:Signal transduction histidine kinase involved in nitrogen fixation and metabolism regulation
MASNNQIDINIFDPHGRLIRSSKSELFDKFLLSSRINPKAYEQIIYKKKKQVINKEHLSELSYTSLYAPIFNTHGKLVAIVNIPYFFKDNIITNDVSTILATIINIYILLILASILGGTMVSNQISKPLAELSRKMQYISVSTKAEHIDYKNNDELGVLVNAYNKMVDDLEESTIRLAQTEREKAWSEMARQIAHEIKNPLTPMRLSIQHLIRLKQNNVEGWENKFEDVAGSILEQIDILSNTASEFSSFAKFYYEENSIINLYQILSEQKTLFDTRDNIRIAFYHCSEECNIYARKGQIIRVIVNLLSNAIQAVEDNGRGYIKISLNQDKEMYSVSFEDNGYGVKEEDESKLFKPNFTTKSSGTGLGLAISKNIIEQSGGKIFYKKSEFGGACFTFTLPKHISNFIN